MNPPLTRAVTPTHFPWFKPTGYTFSLGLVGAGQAWFSGHTGAQYGAGAGGMVVPDTLEEQARVSFAKLSAVLEAADRTWGDVLRVTEYVRADAVKEYATIEGVRAETLGEHRPAVSTIVVHGLMRPDAMLEVEIAAGDPAVDEHVTGPDQERPAFTPSRTTAHGLTYLSSVLPVDEAGNVIGGDDLVAQTAAVYEKAAAMLEPLGLGTEHIVKTVEFVKPHTRRDYPKTGRIRKEHLAAPYGGGTGIVMDEHAHPDALISIDFVASPLPREAVNPGWERYGKLTYNPAIKVGNVLVMSGQAALDVETEKAVHAGDVVAQTRYTYENILRVLDAAGVGPEALVQTVEYVTPEGLADYRKTAKVRAELMTEPYPVATGIVCSGLLRPEFQIEVDPWAILPDDLAGPS